MNDVRTRYERQVLERIKRDGGASIFWITSNRLIASATQRLEERGTIIRKRKSKYDKYPWCVYAISGEQ